MVPIPPQTQAVEKHIPAWKKLGLKLKYAKEELSPSEIPNGSPSTVSNEKKRKLSPEIPIDTPTVKKPKKSKPKSKPSGKDATTNPSSSPQPLESYTSSPTEPRKSKQRSVSFTPATKAHDGEGVKDYIKRWSASNPERAENFKAMEAGYYQSESGAEVEREEGSAVETKKKKKKKKKRKSKSTTVPLKPASGIKTPKLPASGPTSTQSGPSKGLQYLEHHQTSPSTWKFSKSRQNSLFRSLFSLIEIPSSYDSALLAYLRGLSRTAAATSRVRNMALDVRKGDEEWTKKEGKEERQQDRYARAVEKMKAGLRKGYLEDLDPKAGGPEEDEVKRKEWEERLGNRRRAEVILFAVGDQADPTPPPAPTSASIAAIKPTKTYLNSTSLGPSTTTTNNNNNSNRPQPPPTVETMTTTPFVKPKRKRKTRTLAFSSSSSSSSSESSSSESDREKKKETNPAVVRKKLVWDTRSSDDDNDDDSSSSASE